MKRLCTGRLKKRGLPVNRTLFSTLLAAYAVLLYRLTGQDDIIIGIPAAGQSVVGEHDLVAHCTNLLPLRIRLEGSRPFTGLLKSVQSMVLDAFENQMVTFGSIVKKLQLPRDARRPPLLSAMFNVDPAIHGLDFAGLDVQIAANPRCGFQFDLNFNMVVSDAELFLECDYNTDIFTPATIHRWMNCYRTLLANIAGNADLPIDALSLLPADELQQLVVAWNDTARPYPHDRCLHHLFEAQAEKSPDAVAAVFEQETDHLPRAECPGKPACPLCAAAGRRARKARGHFCRALPVHACRASGNSQGRRRLCSA